MSGIKAVAEAAPDPKKGTPRRVSGVSFPYFGLAESIEVAQVMHEKAGGECDRAQLAALLGNSTTKSGAFLSRVTAAKIFGVIEQEGDRLRVSKRGRQIVSPVVPADAERAKVDAFLGVELFKKVYDEYNGTTLPSEVGLRNLLETRYQVVQDRIAPTVRVMKESAETAGFFKAAGAGRLVMPLLAPASSVPPPPPADHLARHDPPRVRHGGGGDDGGRGNGPEIHPAILGLLGELPPAGTPMDQKRRERLIAAFTATVGFIYPDVPENGSDGK